MRDGRPVWIGTHLVPMIKRVSGRLRLYSQMYFDVRTKYQYECVSLESVSFLPELVGNSSDFRLLIRLSTFPEIIDANWWL